jgi:hypothetical protein
MIRRLIAPAALLVAAGLAGCASDGSGFLSTASIAEQKSATAAKSDPACVTLAAQIETVRKEGAVDGLEKAAAGKTATVQVKRASLAKQAELNRLNTEFQAKCSSLKPTTAQAPTAAQQTASAAPKPEAAAPAKQ